MMRAIFTIFLIGLAFVLHSQVIPNEIEACVIYPSNVGNDRSAVNLSTNGKFLTPKGDLRVLVVYAKFNEEETVDPSITWPYEEDFPLNHVDGTTGEILWGHNDPSDFSDLIPPSPFNISDFYYEMSEGAFRVYYETLRDEYNTSVSIEIDPEGLTSFSDAKNAIYEVIRNEFPQDWSRFDMRNNSPNWQTDESATLDCLLADPPCGDNKIDYIAIILRNRSTWGFLDTDGNGVSTTLSGSLGNNYQGDVGFMIYNYSDISHSFYRFVIHEDGHGFVSLPHYTAASTIHGKYFFTNYGGSNMNGYGRVNCTSNAWERWYFGWTEITHDLDESSTSQTYNINEYLRYGGSMRLKLPHTLDQYVWLEYHGDTTNPFYGRIAYINDNLGNPIEQQPPGLYGYIERVAPDYETVNRISPGANGIKVINGLGHFDFSFNGFYNRPYNWNNDVLKVNRHEANPYGGQHENSWFRFDINSAPSAGGPDGKINWDSNAYYGGNENGLYNEGWFIMEVDDEVVWGSLAPNIVLPENKISAFTNPPLSNFVEIRKLTNPDDSQQSPVILHSLSITPSNPTGTSISVDVDYNDGHIENDFRMTGNVYLPSNEVITLDPSKTLTIDKTNTPNRIFIKNGSFFDPSVFIAAEDGELDLDSSSKVILDESTTMIFESGSTLDMGDKSKIYIRDGSLLCLKEGATVNFDNLSMIVVEDGYLQVDPSINITGHVTYTGDYFGTPQVYNVLHDYCGPTSNPEHIHSTIGIEVSSANCSTNPITISSTDKVKLTSDNYIEINSIFEAVSGSYFDAEILSIANDCDLEFWFGTDGVPDQEIYGFHDNNLKSPKNELDISVVPNPSNGIFDVRFSKILDNFNYQLYDYSGNLIYENSGTSTDFVSVKDISFNKGFYILKVWTSTETGFAKIIVD